MKNNYYYILLFLVTSSFCQTFSPFFPAESSSGFSFGSVIAMDSNQVLVSSTSALNLPENVGKTYLFDINENGLEQTETFLRPDDFLATDNFGCSLSIQNDFIAIGSSTHQNAKGAVCIFRKINGEWQFFQKVMAFDGSDNDLFGHSVTIHNDHLLITALNDIENGSSVVNDGGAVYDYTFNGDIWEFSQKIDIAEVSQFGEQIECENNIMILSGVQDTGVYKILYRYALINGFWILENTSQTFGSDEDFYSRYTFTNNQLFLTTTGFGPQQVVEVYNYSNDSWVNVDNVALPMQTDFFYSNVKISNNEMFIGATNYMLATERKFPVLHYKNLNGSWQYHETYYGNGPVGVDDHFGSAMAISGNNLIVGAHSEGSVLPYGKAYYSNLTLGIEKIDKSELIFYPNPVKSSAIILNNSSNTIERMNVYSINGDLIFSKTSDFENINTEKLSNGFYFIKITMTNAAEEFIKFIKI